MNGTVHTGVAVIGAGLAGLHAARLLDRAGADWLLLEARDRPGGRILSVDANGAPGGALDLGPSWYWPAMQPAMAGLVETLGLTGFAQHASGALLVERVPGQAPQRFAGYPQAPASMRLAGGTGALVRALMHDLPPERMRFGVRVVALHRVEAGVRIETGGAGADARAGRVLADRVIAALPPRLLAANVRFDPPPAPAILRRWAETPTWMAPHAKVVALYPRPFWRTAGLSGDAQSAIGPMVEIHDACTAEGDAALFGFVGVPAEARAAAGEPALKRACVDQLARLFGEEARTPRAVLLKDWAADPLTAVVEDRRSTGHGATGSGFWVDDPWRSKLTLAGSETSPVDAGYLSGAIVAAENAVRETLAARASRSEEDQ